MDGTCLVVRQGLGHWYIYLASLKFIFAHAIEKFQPSAISHWTREGWLECAGEVIFKPYLHSKESISQSYRGNPWIREVTAKGKILIEVDEVSFSIIHRYRHSKVGNCWSISYPYYYTYPYSSNSKSYRKKNHFKILPSRYIVSVDRILHLTST